MKTRLVATAIISAGVAGCQTAPPLFEFGSYEQSLYVYYKKPDQADRYRESLEKAIERGERNGNVAPGMYAELGYLNSLDGDYDAAVAMYEREIETFPESEYFLSRVISKLTTPEAVDSDDAASALAGA